MKTELDEILEFYENEKLTLEKLIEEFVAEREFKQAHIHQKALRKVNLSISLFKTLENPNFLELEHLLNQLERYSSNHFKKLMEESPFMRDFFKRDVKCLEEKISSFNEKPIAPHSDSQEFDDIIFDLIEDKLNNFHFFLNTGTNLYLDFKKVNQSIVITIPKYKNLKKKYVLSKANRNKLKDIGFKLTDDKKNLVFIYDISSFRDANPIKTIVSRIIYEGFGHYNIENSSVIVIIN